MIYNVSGVQQNDSVLHIYIYIKSFTNYLINLFLATLDLHCCARAFSSCKEYGLLSCCSEWASHYVCFSYFGS